MAEENRIWSEGEWWEVREEEPGRYCCEALGCDAGAIYYLLVISGDGCHFYCERCFEAWKTGGVS